MAELSAHISQIQHGQLTESFPDNHLTNTVCNKQFYYLLEYTMNILYIDYEVEYQ